MRTSRPVLGSLLLSAALSGPAFAQQPPAPHGPSATTSSGVQAGATPDSFTLQLKAQAVVLDVVVTNAKGEIVTNLGKDDFQVLEDKVPQVIRTLDSPASHAPAKDIPIHSTAELDRLEPNAPVTLIVLDEINTPFGDEAFARDSLKKFLDRQGETLQQPTLLGAVDLTHFMLLHDYTTSRQDILSALDHHFAAYPWHMDGASWKADQFNASFASLIEIAEATRGHSGHKSLIWVGRGFPPFDPTTLPEQFNEGLKQVIESCTDALTDARVALYTLDPAGISMAPEEVDADGFVGDPFGGQIDFNVMAEATGGHAFFGRNDVDKLIAASARDGAGFYTLTYAPAVARTDAKEFRSIRVVMKDPSLHAATRQGYYSRGVSASGPAKVVLKGQNRQIFDLGLAAQSVLVYDAVHIDVQRVAGPSGQFRLVLNSADLAWHEAGARKLDAKITVIAETFDSKGNALDLTSKLSTLQVGEASVPNTPDSATVSLFDNIPTKPSATRIRFVVRDETNRKIGAVNFDLNGVNKGTR
ncbi:MAG TPA: VWA domain-containing protein [Acidobacteriaceae bacterium]|nr:VWA domain-containing protein [Acidobacteriaceae bacterium]